MRPRLALALPAVLLLLLAACDSAEDRAEGHFQSALELAEEGDIDRALVELRNVFRLDGAHREARRIYAQLQHARGELEDAYGNYLRLVEFHPEDLQARLALTTMALRGRDWDEAERHGRAADALAPEDPAVRAVVAALDYRAAVAAQNPAGRAAAVQQAWAALEEAEGSAALPARVVVIDQLVTERRPEAALAELDLALQVAPDRRDLQELRLRLLLQEDAAEAVAAQLADMVERFPEDAGLPELLVSWHLRQGEHARAEAFLRSRIAARPGDGWAPLALIDVIRDHRGPEAASAALDRLIAETGEPVALRRARAELARAEGRRADAIAELEAIATTTPPGDARHDAEVRLAQLLLRDGDRAAAEARVTAVLAADGAHVGALKLRAAWAIDDDRPGEAILALRRALTQEPRDPSLMLLLAEAHLRDGSRDLAAERLVLVVEVSNRGVRESLRYAAFLAEQGRIDTAEAVLDNARRSNPEDPRPLVALAELRIAENRLDAAARSVATLRARADRLQDADARRTVDRLQAALLARQDRLEETAALLDGVLARGEGDLTELSMILQTRLAQGDLAAAEATVEALLQDRPDDPTLRFLRAGLHRLAGDSAEAEAIWRALMEEAPQAEGPVVALHGQLQAEGRHDEAAALLEAGLAAQPGSVRLRWMQATALEAAGDPEGAIAIYEALYAENTANPVFANNLASLLSTVRDDDASLERAFAIARRLRHSDVPAFRDTYGWIEHRRGNHAAALAHLEPAAEALPDVALVQFHLGMTLAALDRDAEAAATLERALALPGLPAPQTATAERTLAALAEARARESGQ